MPGRWMQGLLAVAVVLACCEVSAETPTPAANTQLLEAQAAFDQGKALGRSGKYVKAVQLAERALALRKAALGERHEEVASCLNLLGELHLHQGDVARAEPLFLRALEIREEVLGKNHPNVGMTLNNLAALYEAQGLHARAEPLYERALQALEVSVGADHPNVAITLNNLALLYTNQGSYARAERLLKQALEILRKAPKSRQLNIAATLNNLAHVYSALGLYARAEPLYEEALKLQREALGSGHPHVATTLNNLALLYTNQGLYARAEPLYARALEVVEAALGKAHPETARTLNNLALLYTNQGLYARAEPLYVRAIGIVEASLGKNNPTVAMSLDNLAALYTLQGRYTSAKPLYERAFQIRKAAHGENHPDTANSLNNLALFYKAQGLYARAVPLLKRALEIQKSTLGKDHPAVANSLSNLATLYGTQGLYAEVEPLFERALQIRRAALGDKHPSVAQTFNNFAAFYMNLGLHARAEPLYKHAIEVGEASLGSNHPELAQTINNLAVLYAKQGHYTQAEPLYERALQIRKTALGKNHPKIAETLGSLAGLYKRQGLYARAEPLLIHTLEIQESTLGARHPDVARSLNNLATVYIAQGLYTRAEPLLVRARKIQEAALSDHHPSTILSLNNLAALHLAQVQLDAALPLLQRALTQSEQHLRQQVHGFSEQSLGSFLRLMRTQEDVLYSLVRAYPDHPRVPHLALSAALLRQGRSAQEIASTSRIIYRHMKPADRDAFERLRGLRTEFASLSLAGPGDLSSANHQRRLKALAFEGNRLEAALARRSKQFRDRYVPPLPDQIVSQVRAALPRDGVLIEFVAYNDRPPVLDPDLPQPQVADRMRYLALLLFADGRIRTADLGPAEPIERASQSLHDALEKSGDYLPAARALYELAFQPLQPHLDKARRLFIVPDGQLNLIPFAALYDGERFLAEPFDITYLTSGKDLLPRSHSLPSRNSVVVLADPEFTAPIEPSATAQTERKSTLRSAALDQFWSSLRSQQADSSWVPLPATRREATTIEELFPKAWLLLGALATKQALLSVSKPGILHIATHGFFLDEASPPPSPEPSRGPVTVSTAVVGVPMPKCPPEALLCSGLVLAGAGASAAAAGSRPFEQSWVTAFELAGLDLWGTQLVVLSACDSGRGDVRVGQGVAGLRRALVTAGAETLVTSLWKVNDDTTALLMESYYRRLRQGQGRTSALRDAMSELRQKQPHPHFWAPFIALGIDSPLRGFSSPSHAQATH
jgi:CHAT domain-containing protein/Tfp pilus assembly protein PilF